MSSQFIPIVDLSAQISSLKNELDNAIERVLLSGEFILSSEVKAFENEVAHYLGVKYAVAVCSCNVYIQIVLYCLHVFSCVYVLCFEKRQLESEVPIADLDVKCWVKEMC